jgi:hypothetical protein
MTIKSLTAICKTCKKDKPLTDFFLANDESRAKLSGHSAHCIDCHDAGLVPYGYGWKDFPKRPDPSV